MHYQDPDRRANLVSGLLLGAAVGATLALLSSPLTAKTRAPSIGSRLRRFSRTATGAVDRWSAELEGPLADLLENSRDYLTSLRR